MQTVRQHGVLEMLGVERSAGDRINGNNALDP